MSVDEFAFDVDPFRTAGKESWAHLWGKLELERRRRTRTDPWFTGEYRFERKAADRVPDCAVVDDEVNRWIEIVTDSDQPYRAKTREALRLGFVVHWVFNAAHSEQRRKARRALTPEVRDPFRFGEYDPDTGRLDVGDPITFKNYRFPVESIQEFKPREILGYRRGIARIDQVGGGFDLGLFDVAGCQRRVLASSYGSYFCAVAPTRSVEEATWGYPTPDGLERLVEAGDITRLGPVRRDG